MVNELAKLMEKAAQLPVREQQVLASILEEELTDEAAWSRRFAETPATLEMLVKRAKERYEAGACSEDL